MKTKKKILIYGGSGLLGSEIIRRLSNRYILIYPTHKEMDITLKHDVIIHLELTNPDYIIYAAGITKNEEAKKYPGKTYQLNSHIPSYIAIHASKMGIPMCYLSSNAVFDGLDTTVPFRETDLPSPISIYGKSKLLGENAILKASDKNLVIRLVMLYSVAHDKKMDFARAILVSLSEDKQTAGIVDQFITPLFVPTAVNGLNIAIEKNARGIYHLASTNRISNYNFVKLLAKNFKFDDNLIFSVSFDDFSKSKLIYKIKNSCLDVNKFENELGKGILQTVENDLRDFKNSYDH